MTDRLPAVPASAIDILRDNRPEDMPRVNSRYGHRVTESMRAELSRYMGSVIDSLDFSDELAILRKFIGDAVAQLSIIETLPTADATPVPAGETPEQAIKRKQNWEKTRNALVATAKTDVVAAINELLKAGQVCARIQQSRNAGKYSGVVINQMVGVISQSVESSLQEYAPALRTAGVRPEVVAENIAARISGAIATSEGIDSRSAVTISSVPTRITTDQIAIGMDDTIPHCA